MNKALIRNIIIILVLLIAIVVVVDLTKQKKERLAAEKAEQERIAEQQRAEKQARRKQEALAKERDKTGQGGGADDADGFESSYQGLQRLAEALRSGSREEMPPGCVQAGDSWFLPLDESFTWLGAWAFADKFGARPAVVKSAGLLSEITAANGSGADLWLGAGDAGGGEFRWVDGSRWSGPDSLQGASQMLVLDGDGKRAVASPLDQRGVVLEWTASETPGGSLSAYLGGFDPGLDPFPPATVTSGGQAYAYIPAKVSWQEARRLASSMGGTLAVAGGSKEVTFIGRIVQNRVERGDEAWMGAFSKDDGWQWVSGEKGVEIKTQEPEEGHALALEGGDKVKLNKLPIGSIADGFIIEWGGAAEKKEGGEKISPERKAKNAAIVKKLRLKARGAAGPIVSKRNEKLKDNTKDFLFDCRAWLRGLPGTEKERFSPVVGRLETLSEGKTLPEKLEDGIYPQEVLEIYNDHRRREKRILTESREELDKLRAAYVSKLGEAVEKAQQEGRAHLAGLFRGEIQRCGEDAATFEAFIGR